MKQKTAMMKLGSIINEMIYNGGDEDLEAVKYHIRQLLEKEKEQIKNAVVYGNRQEYYDGTEQIGEFYYNETFKQD